MEEMITKLVTALEGYQLVVDYPCTVWTFANVLDFNLTQEQRTKADLLAYKVFNFAASTYTSIKNLLCAVSSWEEDTLIAKEMMPVISGL